MNVTSVRSTTRCCARRRARRPSRRFRSATFENVTSPVDRDDLRRHAHAPGRHCSTPPVRATRGGALHVRCPSAARTGRPGTAPSRPARPAPRSAAPAPRSRGRRPARSGGRCRRPAAAGPRPSPRATPVWRTALATSSVASSRRSWAVRGPSASDTGSSAAATSRAACSVAGKRSETTRGGVTCSARQAMSSRGCPAAISTAVRSRCSTTASGPSAARLGDQLGQLGLGQQPARRGGLADAVGVEREQVAGAELGADLGQLRVLDDPQRRADLAERASSRRRRGPGSAAGVRRSRPRSGRRSRSAPAAPARR